MKKILKISALLIISILAGFVYGYFVHRNEIFPSSLIKKVYLNKRYSSVQWAIGVYEGTTPFNLADPKKIDNPVISRGDNTTQ